MRCFFGRGTPREIVTSRETSPANGVSRDVARCLEVRHVSLSGKILGMLHEVPQGVTRHGQNTNNTTRYYGQTSVKDTHTHLVFRVKKCPSQGKCPQNSRKIGLSCRKKVSLPGGSSLFSVLNRDSTVLTTNSGYKFHEIARSAMGCHGQWSRDGSDETTS